MHVSDSPDRDGDRDGDVILGLAATGIGVRSSTPGPKVRRVARGWRWALGVGVAGYLGLLPGMVLAYAVFGVESEALVGLVALLALGGLLVSLAAARARDRVVTLSSGGVPASAS